MQLDLVVCFCDNVCGVGTNAYFHIYVVILNVELEYTNFNFCQDSKLARVPDYQYFPVEIKLYQW